LLTGGGTMPEEDPEDVTKQSNFKTIITLKQKAVYVYIYVVPGAGAIERIG
jgi:hypothetical protein